MWATKNSKCYEGLHQKSYPKDNLPLLNELCAKITGVVQLIHSGTLLIPLPEVFEMAIGGMPAKCCL